MVSFKNSILIMTSNLGSGAIMDTFLALGGAEGAGGPSNKERGPMRELVMAAVRSHFRPEFINRIDDFIIFDPLKLEQIKAIVRLQVSVAQPPSRDN